MTVPPLFSSSASSSYTPSTLQQREGGSSSSITSPASPLPTSYDELLRDYQQLTSERDALSSQVEKLKEAAMQKALQPAATAPSSSFSPRAMAGSSGSSSSASHGAPSLDSLREQHSAILSGLSGLQDSACRVLQEQERELIRAFRLRLSEVTAELSEERRRSESGSAEWVQRCRKMGEELDWLKGVVERLTADNGRMQREARRLRRQIRTQEEDREFLIQQLVSAKKENSKLRLSSGLDAKGKPERSSG
jgi:hypothetical protein